MEIHKETYLLKYFSCFKIGQAIGLTFWFGNVFRNISSPAFVKAQDVLTFEFEFHFSKLHRRTFNIESESWRPPLWGEKQLWSCFSWCWWSSSGSSCYHWQRGRKHQELLAAFVAKQRVFMACPESHGHVLFRSFFYRQNMLKTYCCRQSLQTSGIYNYMTHVQAEFQFQADSKDVSLVRLYWWVFKVIVRSRSNWKWGTAGGYLRTLEQKCVSVGEEVATSSLGPLVVYLLLSLFSLDKVP